MSDLCILIPTYNDTDTIPLLLDRLAVFDFPILIVNDGSRPPTHHMLDREAAKRPYLRVKHRPENGGKGAAIIDGLRWAHDLGFQSALQIDADGQHETDDIPKFAAAASDMPDGLILGEPIFDASVPKSRLYGRQLSKWLVWVQTLSFSIHDPLFGYRVYPVERCMTLMNKVNLGTRMDFDAEIAVRLYWQGAPIRNIASPVYYPDGGLSNFRMIRDNIRLTWLHTRLVLGMLIRSPKLIWRKRSKS